MDSRTKRCEASTTVRGHRQVASKEGRGHYADHNSVSRPHERDRESRCPGHTEQNRGTDDPDSMRVSIAEKHVTDASGKCEVTEANNGAKDRQWTRCTVSGRTHRTNSVVEVLKLRFLNWSRGTRMLTW